MPKKEKSSIPDHTHCWFCDRPFPREDGGHFCSDECRKHYDVRETEQRRTYRRRQLLSMLPLIALAVYFVWILLTALPK